MVLLSALPCNDDLDNQTLTSQNSSKVEQKKSQEAESCSPICLCSCCGQSVVATELGSYNIKNPILLLRNLIAVYQFKLPQSDKNIWQPPKLG